MSKHAKPSTVRPLSQWRFGQRLATAVIAAAVVMFVGALSGAFGPTLANAASTVVPGYHTVTNSKIAPDAVSASKIRSGAVHNSDIADKTITHKDLGPYLKGHTLTDVTVDENGNLVLHFLDGTSRTVEQGGNGGGGEPTPKVCKLADGVDRSITTDAWNYPADQKVGPAQVKATKKGKVRVKITDATSYADAGVVVPLGTVADVFDTDGTLKPLDITGPGKDKVNANLWVDTTDDDKFGPATQYKGLADGKDSYWFYNDNPIRADLGDTPDDAQVWAWVGITVNSGSEKAVINTVNGQSLATCE